MNEGRFTHSAVSTSDYQNIIVFGGFQNQPLRSVEVYNTVENKWTTISQMEEERYLHCSILIQE
jgi:influenza virus NS1A-binding protein